MTLLFLEINHEMGLSLNTQRYSSSNSVEYRDPILDSAASAVGVLQLFQAAVSVGWHAHCQFEAATTHA